MPEPYKAVLPLPDILRPLIHVLYEAKPAMENSKPVCCFCGIYRVAFEKTLFKLTLDERS